jgi:hypothetical protein
MNTHTLCRKESAKNPQAPERNAEAIMVNDALSRWSAHHEAPQSLLKKAER